MLRNKKIQPRFKALNAFLFFLLLPVSGNAKEKSACPGLYAALSEEQKTDFETKLDSIVNSLNANPSQTEREQLNNNLLLLLESHGIRAELPTASDPYFRILPDGKTKISQTILKLKKNYGIEVRLSPEVLKDSRGAYSKKDNAIYIDLKTLANDQLSPVLAHEVRHAVGALRSENPERNFERNFQARLNASPLTKIIPGTEAGAYDSHYKLDEILAHRQSAKNLVKIILQKQKRGQSFEAELKQLRNHGGRFRRFVDGWKASAKIMNQEISAGSFDYTFFLGPVADGYKNIAIKVSEARFLQKLTRFSQQNPEHVGLELELLVSNEEFNSSLNKNLVAKLARKKIQEISEKIIGIEPAVAELEQAFSKLDDTNFSELDQKLTNLSRALGAWK